MFAREWASVLFVLPNRRLVSIPPHPDEFRISSLKRDFYRVGQALQEIVGEKNETGVFVETFLEINILKRKITALMLFEELERYRALFGGEYLCTLYDLHFLATRTSVTLGRREPNVSFIDRGGDRVRVDLTFLSGDRLGIFSNSLVARERNSPNDSTQDIWLSTGTHIITSRLY